MAYYLSEFIGDGSTLNPFRPPVGGSWGIIDLRGDSTVQAGRCLLWHPDGTLSDARLEKVADDSVASIPRNISRRIENVLGVTLSQFDTLQAIIAELLILHGSTTDPGRWKPLQADRFGRHRIFLGGPIYDAPAPQGAVITDDFNRANEDLNGSQSAEGWSWAVTNGTWSITSNVIVSGSSGTLNRARAESDLATDDHYAQFVLATGTGNMDGGPAVRYSAAADTFYLVVSRSSADDAVIRKVVSGSETDLLEDDTAVAVDGDVLRLEVDGSTIEAFLDGVSIGPTTDSDITGNIRTGIQAFADGRQFDTFEAGDLSAAFDPANLDASVVDDDVTLTWDV